MSELHYSKLNSKVISVYIMICGSANYHLAKMACGVYLVMLVVIEQLIKNKLCEHI